MARVLAARFPDREHATAALETLHDQLDESVEAEIAPLATNGSGLADDTLLAGHFADEQARDVVDIVRQTGGEIVADVDERWTRPNYRPDTTDSDRGYSY
jgi:hypothetical protein